MKPTPHIPGRRLAGLAALVCSLAMANAAPLGMEEITRRATDWMNQHPLMNQPPHTISGISAFPGNGAPYSVYTATLSPAGYLILNSDDKLPLVVAFSAQSPLSLENTGDNALHAMLVQYLATAKQQLAGKVQAVTQTNSTAGAPLALTSGDELIGPLLETSWNQNAPYNSNCPIDPAGTAGYGYRAPTGSTPTALAQILRYHCWPVRGQGSHSYTDSTGTITGTFAADFTADYAWTPMLPSYGPPASHTPESMQAVGRLMSDLGIATDTNYEHSGTGNIIELTGERIARHFYFEDAQHQTSEASVLAAIQTDLRAGNPGILEIPDHLVVADGLSVVGGVTTYHINYGWGGTNNGWFSADAIPASSGSGGTSGVGGVTSIQPRLLAFPKYPAVTATAGQSFSLQWTLPKRRETSASSLMLFTRQTQPQPWTSDASGFNHAVVRHWSLATPEDRAGTCWFAGPTGPATLDLSETFVPDSSSVLRFWRKFMLGTTTFTLSVTNNGGMTYTPLLTLSNAYADTWQQQSVSLSAYAGQTIQLRLELGKGSYYAGGGIWIDDPEITTGTWKSWVPATAALPMTSIRFSSVETPWDSASNFTIFENTSSENTQDWEISTLDNGGTGFHKANGAKNLASKYHITSYGTITPTNQTRLRLRAKYKDLETDSFRVLVSTDRVNFTQIAQYVGTCDWQNLTIPLSAQAGQAIYLRLEYVVSPTYYPNGGIWIDSISTEQVTNPELEDQPVHITTLSLTTPGTYEAAAALIDTSSQQHGISPPFALQINPGNHTVNFLLGTHGTRSGGGILTQTVAHNGTAVAPEISPSPGWLFTGWSAPLSPIVTDLSISAVYTAKLAAQGTPVWWLLDHGLAAPDATDPTFNAVEASDPHGKGYPVAYDYLFGTNPNHSADRFRITSPMVAGGQFTMHWTGKSGRIYQVKRSSTLAPGSWQTISTQNCNSDNQPMQFTEPSQPGTPSFYRLGVSLAE